MWIAKASACVVVVAWLLPFSGGASVVVAIVLVSAGWRIARRP